MVTVPWQGSWDARSSPGFLLSSFSAHFHSLDIYERETQLYPASPDRWDLLKGCYMSRRECGQSWLPLVQGFHLSCSGDFCWLCGSQGLWGVPWRCSGFGGNFSLEGALLGVGHMGFDLREMSVQVGAAQSSKSSCAAGKMEPGRQEQHLQPLSVPWGHGHTQPVIMYHPQPWEGTCLSCQGERQ